MTVMVLRPTVTALCMTVTVLRTELGRTAGGFEVKPPVFVTAGWCLT